MESVHSLLEIDHQLLHHDYHSDHQHGIWRTQGRHMDEAAGAKIAEKADSSYRVNRIAAG